MTIKSKILPALRTSTKKGFTLLEIMIVIIIIGVLASLALPRYIKVVEYARGLEALIQIGSLRQSMHRYYVPKKTYTGATLNNLDLDNPSTDPNAHFSYAITIPTPITFLVTATRNNRDNGDGISTMSIDQDGQKSGTGVYSGIR